MLLPCLLLTSQYCLSPALAFSHLKFFVGSLEMCYALPRVVGRGLLARSSLTSTSTTYQAGPLRLTVSGQKPESKESL